MPTQSYSLDELVHLASVRLSKLQRGQCVVKIGIRPAVSLRTVHVKDGWARPEHINRVVDDLAAATPYVASVEEAVESQRQRQRRRSARCPPEPRPAPPPFCFSGAFFPTGACSDGTLANQSPCLPRSS